MIMVHDSRRPRYRNPGGALACSSEVTLFIETDEDTGVLRLWIDNHAYLYTMEKVEGGLSYTLKLPDRPCVVWYYFIVDGVYYGNARDNLGGVGEIYDHEPPSFQITVYDENFSTPEWLRNGVMMQILPDRFYMAGDNKNRTHNNWYEQPEMKITDNGDNTASDFFGGNLRGITEKLDYIANLGVTVLYLNPVFMARSNHKYDTSDYMRIDPSFGTEDDLKELCSEGKKRGIRVILDGVFSHTGADSVYFNKFHHFNSVGAYNSRDSKYFNWYTFLSWRERYACWWGFDTLPNVNKNSDDFRDFIIRSDDSVCAHWLRAGISGWRLDVADELPMDFINEFRARAKSENPDSAIIGEVWEDPSRKVAYDKLRSYCLGDTLDSVMNYPLRTAILNFLNRRISPERCVREVMSLYENAPEQFYSANMNLLGSHDKPRALTVLAGVGNMEPDRQYRYPIKLTEAQYDLGKRRLICAWNFVCALPGMPTIYYGDEAGMYGMADPYCRAAYPWGREDGELIDAYRNAIALRKSHMSAWSADFSMSYDDTSITIIRNSTRVIIDRENIAARWTDE